MGDFWRNRRVLVSGASGFIGSNLVRGLLDMGADVVGLDRVKESPSLRALGAEVEILARDVRNHNRLAWTLVNGNGSPEWRPPAVVFHLAGMSHPRDCQANPLQAWETNVQGTWAILEACRTLPGLMAVVCASSDRVYGSLGKAPVPILPDGRRAYAAVKQDSSRAAWLEDDAPTQTEVYGLSKACADLLARAYAALGLPVATLRHQNTFGPADPHRSHIVTGTIYGLLDGQVPVIYGDGTTIKGYLHIQDVCHAYMLLAEALMAGQIASGSPVNAAGTPCSVLALVELLIQIGGQAVIPRILGEDLSQSGEVEILDDSRLRSLGWIPKPLEEGLSNTYNWYKEHRAWLSP